MSVGLSSPRLPWVGESHKNLWWNVKSEHISNAKVRFSWGSLGNAAGLSNYQYIQTLGISKSDYILDGLRQNYMSSPAALPGNLTWETATTYDIGADLGFFDNRLTVSGDCYIRKNNRYDREWSDRAGCVRCFFSER